MAHKAHIGQQFDNFSAFENALVHYQNVAITGDNSTSMPKSFNADIGYSEFTYHCIHGRKNFKARGNGKREKI